AGPVRRGPTTIPSSSARSTAPFTAPRAPGRATTRQAGPARRADARAVRCRPGQPGGPSGHPGAPPVSAGTPLRLASAQARVGVQAGDEGLHDQHVEQQTAETDQLNVRGPLAPPARRGPGVQEARVDDPGDEGPRLDRVPAPVTAPGLVSPDRA